MHNGYINEFGTIKRDLVLAVDPSLYPKIRGQADTEVLFCLALTFGLEEDSPAAVGQAIGLVEDVAERHGVPHPFQGTVATTDGESARGRTRGGRGNDKGRRLKRCEAVELADPVFSADGGLRAPFPWHVRPRSRDEAFAVEGPGARTADSAGPSRSEMGSAEPKKTDGGSCLASVQGARLLGSRHQRKSASRASHSTGSATSQMAERHLEPWPASRCAGQSVTWAWSGWLEAGNRERPACSPRRAATATIQRAAGRDHRGSEAVSRSRKPAALSSRARPPLDAAGQVGFNHPGEQRARRFRFGTSGVMIARAVVLQTPGNPSREVLMADTQMIEQLEAEQSMFVQTAQGMTSDGKTLTLEGVTPSTLYFSDRPQRVVGHMATGDFVDLWGEGDNSFEEDPPNAVLAFLEPGYDVPEDAVIVIKVPRLDDGQLSYSIQTLEGTVPAQAGPVTLFIDPFGRPLSPVSVCGVRRRERRRDRRRF